jgi:RNA polymerase primary sigma factor
MRQLRITPSITNRDGGCLEKYLHDIASEGLLSVDEESTLTQQTRMGDLKAMHKLIKGNLRFVVSVAKQYQGQGLSLPDLINEGNIGLIKAAQKFDETKGFKFISYAVWWIRQTIMMALVDKVRTVRIPFNQVNVLGRIKKMQQQLEQRYEREASAEELSEELSLDKEQVKEVLRANIIPMHLDSPIDQEEGTSTMLEIIEDKSAKPADDELTKESVRFDVKRSLKTLKPREQEIVKLYFGIECEEEFSIQQIADRLELTRERVRQVKEKAIKKLKGSSRAKILMFLLA